MFEIELLHPVVGIRTKTEDILDKSEAMISVARLPAWALQGRDRTTCLRNPPRVNASCASRLVGPPADTLENLFSQWIVRSLTAHRFQNTPASQLMAAGNSAVWVNHAGSGQSLRGLALPVRTPHRFAIARGDWPFQPGGHIPGRQQIPPIGPGTHDLQSLFRHQVIPQPNLPTTA